MVAKTNSRSQWPRGLRRRSATAGLLRSWVRIPPGAWMFVCYECCVLSGGGLCDGLITRLEECYRLWRVVVCDLEISWMRGSWPTGGLSRHKQTNKQRPTDAHMCMKIYYNLRVPATCFDHSRGHPQTGVSQRKGTSRYYSSLWVNAQI